MKLNRFFALVVLLFGSSAIFAQREKAFDTRDYQYKKEASGGFRAQTNGFSFFAEYGWIKDIYKTRLIQLEYTYYIDYRQQKTQARGGDRDFFYGMQNKLHMLRFSYGIKRSIADKADHAGVRLSFFAFGGLSVALLKPYYLNLRTDAEGHVSPERYSAENATRFLSLDSIVEAAPARYGLSEISPVFGAHGKMGLDFDFGRRDEFLCALQTGIMLDVYYKQLPVMINSSNHFYQVALYVSIQLGKRW